MYIALTIDDGFIDHLYYARLLREYGVRATFFITTHPVDGSWISSKPEYIQAIAELGHEVGSHSNYHVDLTLLPRESVEENLRFSKKFLEDLLGVEVLSFAYPYGRYNLKVISTVIRYYEAARGSFLYPWEDPLNLEVTNLYTIIAGVGPHIPTIFSRTVKFRKYSTPFLLVKHLVSVERRRNPKLVLVFHGRELLFYLKVFSILKNRSGTTFVTMRELSEILRKEIR